MKHLFRGSRLIVFVMMLSVMTGCAISGGGVPRTKLTAPVEDQAKPTLFYSIYSWEWGEISKEEFLEELRKSQYFKNITNDSLDQADIEMYVTLNKGPNSIPEGMGYFSGMTAGMIPEWGTDDYILEVRVKNKIGLEKEYKLEDSVTIVIWLPLFVFTPFTWNTEENVRRNMYRNIIQQMYEDGSMGAI